jgi:hypothetical protein
MGAFMEIRNDLLRDDHPEAAGQTIHHRCLAAGVIRFFRLGLRRDNS